MQQDTDRPLPSAALPLFRYAANAAAAARVAVGVVALSDALDVAITVAAWPRLPKTTRWLVAASAGSAAIAGATGALAAFLE